MRGRPLVHDAVMRILCLAAETRYELAVTDMLASGSAFMLFFLSSYVRGRRHQLEFKDTSRMHPMKTLTLLTPKVLLTGLELKAIFVA